MLPRPARYFPVTPEPLRMRAGLLPLGEPFGNGPVDGQFFQRDDEVDEYLAAKAKVPAHRYQEVDDAAAVRAAALAWVQATVEREHPALRPRGKGLAELASALQEDVAVMGPGNDGAGRAVVLAVSFPSGWRPERLRGASFLDIHRPVPTFNTGRIAASMMSMMVDRGPLVRFVWTVCADPYLDHHPEEGRREPWTADTPRGWLRVERQVTVPLADVGGAVFLIRTYRYPLDSLSAGQRAALATAVELMPAEIAAYKGLLGPREHILALLGRLPA